MKSKPPAPPLSIANVTQETASGSGDRQTYVKARPAAPPPSITNLKTKQETAPPSRNVKPKQALALLDQGIPHHEDAPASTKKELHYKQQV